MSDSFWPINTADKTDDESDALYEAVTGHPPLASASIHQMLATLPTATERPTTRVDKYVNRLQAAMRDGAARALASTLSSSAPKPSALKTERDTRSRADAQAVNWTSLKPKIHDVIDLCDDDDDEGDLIIVTPAVPPQRTPPKMATAVVHQSENSRSRTLEDNEEHPVHARTVDAAHEVIDLCDSDEDEDQSVEVVPVRAPTQGTALKMATAVVHHSENTHSLKRKEREDDDEDFTRKRPFKASDDVLEVRDHADEEAQPVDIVPAGDPQGTAAKVAAAEAHHSENSRTLKVRIKMSKMTSAAVHPWANSDSPKVCICMHV
ncbi:hypothetical protein CALVIDRAFT_89077 [Calocera viscosa TUFC12733]|uniref:Uncharacterized protein n=1 Tax=Calocera viscosa (strain TUFC12733) TaxID=1330018 RepID=A0A167N7Y2_CALVF|nr:hypothetical protein CALVIDRAFT_89077 [Calocera viscosa TUFC12733]